MADMIWRNALLLAKKETTEGTANAPGATDAILATGIQPNLQRDFHKRQYQGSVGVRAGVIGAQSGAGLAFQTELKGDGSTNSPEINELLENVFGLVSPGTGDNEINGGTSTTTSLVVDSSTNFTVGNMVMVETTDGSAAYEVAMITAVPNGTTITISPALSFTPLDNANVKEMRTYQIAVPPAGVNSLTMDVFYNADAGAGQFDRFVGCHGNLKFDSPGAGSIPMLSWDFSAWNWVQSVAGTRPSPTFDSATPKGGLATKFKIGGTLTDVFDVSWDLANAIARKMSQNSTLGVYGTPITDCMPAGSFKIHPAHTSVAQFTGWTGETTTTLIQQFGTALFGTYAWFCPAAQRTGVARGDDAGVQTNEVTFDATVQDDAAATSVDAGLFLAVG